MLRVIPGSLRHISLPFFDDIDMFDQGAAGPGSRARAITPSEKVDERPSFLKLTPSVFDAILDQLVWKGREQGGLLVGPAGEPLVTHFLKDEEAVATADSFEVDAVRMNARLRPFLELEMNCKGLVHSHPSGVTAPSIGDQRYVRRSLGNPRNNKADEFFLPIVCDGRLYPWIVRREEPLTPRLAQLVLV